MRRKRKILWMSVLTALVAAWLQVPAALADSPVTSTEFFRAYPDEPIVRQADESGSVTEELASYLADESVPLDVRAAVINAIGWEAEGGGRAEALAQYAYGKELSELNASELRGDERFVIGYLLAMDDYYDTASAEQWLEDARKSMPDSFTAAMIHALVAAQGLMSTPASWQEIWNVAAAVAFDGRLRLDMRPEAAEIIIDYMASYSNGAGINPFSSENVLAFRIGDPQFTMNGAPSSLERASGTAPVLRNGTAYLPVRFLAGAVGGTAAWESEGKKAIVTAPHLKMEFAAGVPVVLVNGEERMLEHAPILSGGRVMLPARFIGGALGFEVSWDEKEEAVVLTYPSAI